MNYKDYDIRFNLRTDIEPTIEEDYPTKFFVDLFDGNKLIGTAEILKILALSGEHFFEICDNYSLDLSAIGQGFTKTNKSGATTFVLNKFNDCYDFIVIHFIGFEKEYRGKGIMYDLLKSLDNFFGDDIVYLLIANPLDYTNKEFSQMEYSDEIKNKLIKSYQNSGFTSLKKGSNYMYKFL